MNKAELVSKVADKTGFKKKDAEAALDGAPHLRDIYNDKTGNKMMILLKEVIRLKRKK